MRHIHQQKKAKLDLKKIWLYSFKKHGATQADKYFDELELGFKSIEDNNHIGVACDYICSGYRQLEVNEHYIFYRLSNTTIHIIRVLHKKMKVKKHI